MNTSEPPSENFNGIYYNPVFFSSNNYVTQAYGSNNYLSCIGVANSTASLTSFDG